MISVVVLSRFQEIFEGFRKSVDAEAANAEKIVIWDQGGQIQPHQDSPGWKCANVFAPFHIARNANQGWMISARSSDILYAGDDTRIIEPRTIARLEEVAYSDPKIGIVGARIKPRNGRVPTANPPVFHVEQIVPFVFVFIKREVIDKIGYLDERFDGYGCEDVSYCIDARQAGFKIGFADGVTIQHGVDGHSYGSTFFRVKSKEQVQQETDENWRRLCEKYGLPNDRAKAFEFIERCDKVATGQC